VVAPAAQVGLRDGDGEAAHVGARVEQRLPEGLGDELRERELRGERVGDGLGLLGLVRMAGTGIDAQIAALEAKETPRRIAESITSDVGMKWLVENRQKIAALRSQRK